MTVVGAIWGGIALGLFMAISVGPTLFAIIRYSMNHSYWAGLFFVFGVSLSDILFVSLANFATPLLKELHRFDTILYYAAGILISMVGGIAFFSKYKPQRPRSKSISIDNVKNTAHLKFLLTGFLMNSLNPALIIQWITAAAGMSKESGTIRLIFFGSCLLIVLSIDLLKVLLADNIRSRLTLRKIMYLQKTSTFLLFLIGISILVITFFDINIIGKP